MSLAVPSDVGGVAINYEEVLKALNLNPRDPKVQALVLTCQQYSLDPVLKHMILINGDAYITHKGLLHVAHTSGRFDGIELLDQGETGDEWWARVSVWRNDMRHPFTYVGRYPKSGTNKKYGPEMAITRAESMALRRAFDVAAPVQEEQDWPQPQERNTAQREEAPKASPDADDHRTAAHSVETPEPAGAPVPATEPADPARVANIIERRDNLSPEFVEVIRPRWIAEIGVKAEHLTADKVDEADALLAEIEHEQKQAWDKRRRRARAELTKAGVKDEADVDALILTATGGATSSTAQLTEAQLESVLAQVKPLLEPAPDAA